MFRKASVFLVLFSLIVNIALPVYGARGGGGFDHRTSWGSDGGFHRDHNLREGQRHQGLPGKYYENHDPGADNLTRLPRAPYIWRMK